MKRYRRTTMNWLRYILLLGLVLLFIARGHTFPFKTKTLSEPVFLSDDEPSDSVVVDRRMRVLWKTFKENVLASRENNINDEMQSPYDSTTTVDPFEEFCKVACENGEGGVSCDCADHPIG